MQCRCIQLNRMQQFHTSFVYQQNDEVEDRINYRANIVAALFIRFIHTFIISMTSINGSIH